MGPGYQAYDVEKDELSMHVPAFTLNARPQLVHPTVLPFVSDLLWVGVGVSLFLDLIVFLTRVSCAGGLNFVLLC